MVLFLVLVLCPRRNDLWPRGTLKPIVPIIQDWCDNRNAASQHHSTCVVRMRRHSHASCGHLESERTWFASVSADSNFCSAFLALLLVSFYLMLSRTRCACRRAQARSTCFDSNAGRPLELCLSGIIYYFPRVCIILTMVFMFPRLTTHFVCS